ncbi:unnamed protein product [Cylindrotheca closterium]|uniref:Reverse transcriptase Ty1/copia-type domain-containing protein n=1 Tax=Cylindrotheca closterium TaxID=2856 RepID=A0AAD2FVW2_9STRA|nr:unnamed protein product [Cylindrotheca closterium]
MSQVELKPNLEHFHPFGSPLYVLSDNLQALKSHNKWTDRTRVGIFLCHSPNHASSVPLVLNTKTGFVSPQFHCIYDDGFDTCKRDVHFTSAWQRKAQLHLDEQKKPKTLLSTTNLFARNPGEKEVPLPIVPQFITQWDDGPSLGDLTDDLDSNLDLSSVAPTVPPPAPPDENVDDNIQIDDVQIDNVQIKEPFVHTCSGRHVKPNTRYFNDKMVHAHSAFLETYSPMYDDDIRNCQLLQADHSEEPHSFASIYGLAGSTDLDTMTFSEAMRAHDKNKFVKAMYKELGDHIRRKHWKVVPIGSIPTHKRAIPMVWAMKQKKNPLGEIIKWKARLCSGGHRSIENVDYWNTYAPVVSWSTVHRSINVYKLLQNLYGFKDAGRTWSQFLHKGLIDRGWKQSSIDSCLYTKQNIILVLYVDDACLLSPDKNLINREIKSLQEQYNLTDNGELQDYLGTRFTKLPDGSILLEQPQMINRILEMVGLDVSDSSRVKTHDCPALSTNILDKDPDGTPHGYDWNYRSVVGSLSYVQAMIRPDITMAIQQCARFCNDPKESHAMAVKRICRYLYKTRHMGLHFKPDKTKGLECFVDADWAGSWQDQTSTDPLSSQSGTGYIYAGCPIVWASKLQTLVALSTTEAEYIALSSSLREVIALMNLINELKSLDFKLSVDTPKRSVYQITRSIHGLGLSRQEGVRD